MIERGWVNHHPVYAIETYPNDILGEIVNSPGTGLASEVHLSGNVV